MYTTINKSADSSDDEKTIKTVQQTVFVYNITPA